MSRHTEEIIAMLGDQINECQQSAIREVSALTEHGYAWINLHLRVDGREYLVQADWLANLLNPRGAEGDPK